ncbi:MAG: T9SS type A sorting domain-containing protein [Ferruginibacter sp.]
MKKLYLLLQAALCACFLFLTQISTAQDCSSLSATAIGYESRCASTGSIKVFAGGGTGAYKYKVLGPITSNFTSIDSITGLPPGTYMVQVNDIISNCTFTIEEVVIDGNYQDPRFTLTKADVSCDNGDNATITAGGVQYGRPPFTFTIVAPSPMGVGTANSTGIFNNLKAGDYSIRLTDSCGGIQTRQITVNNYTWAINAYPFTKNSCDEVSGYIRVTDSKGNVSTAGGIPGFMYGVVRFAGDTTWSADPNFTFNPNGSTQLGIVVKDGCNKIKKASTVVSFTPSVGNAVNTYNTNCNSFSAAITDVKNFYNAEFCLYDSANILITCNGTGVFNNLAYGSYCIAAHDSCSDVTITRCFTERAPALSVDNIVMISNRTCNNFTATITGKRGLTSPTFCLYDATDVLQDCNTDGIFTNLLYGSYCIKITDGCIDTTITRCFTTVRPRPSVPDQITPGYANCNNFGVVIRGDSLSNPRFCLIDSLGVELICNNTGVFDSIPFGSYCVNIYDSCYDTTIVRCFGIYNGYIENDIQVHTDNKTCSTFSVTAVSANIIHGQYCLYNAADSLIACNNFGVFDSLAYGAYCIKIHNDCPDTTFISCFTEMPPVPQVDASVTVSNKNCGGFSAAVSGQQNLTDPQYCLYNAADSLLYCNTTGIFDTLAYGSYCIKVTNSCYDTTITRCFSASASPIDIALQLKKSCAYGYAKFTFTLTDAALPVVLKIYDTLGNIFLSRSYNNSIIDIDSIPELTGSNKYKVVVLDNCGGTDSLETGAVASRLTHSANVVNKCPSATWLNGSGNIQATASTNMGSLSVKIIKRNGTAYSPYLNPGTTSGGVYTFNDLGPGTYIVRYKASDGCNKYLYDTVTIQNYQYPSLDRTTVYQCDADGFTVSAAVDFGVGPFAYEIIGSSPASPSIITSPQSSPIFNINNGTSYTLIRLRVLDACGNASLEDASVLPLADNMITATFNCFQMPTTLSIDSVAGATYTWYKKESINSTDSILVGDGTDVFIPTLLPTDTGIYSVHISVNSGCIKRSYFHRLSGACFTYLPVVLKDLSGKWVNDKAVLEWSIANGEGLRRIIIEKKTGNGHFIQAGSITDIINSSSLQRYQFIDRLPGGENYYRLKLFYDNGYSYSNTARIAAAQKTAGMTVYPNPVNDFINVQFKYQAGHQYKINLLNIVNQSVREIQVAENSNGVFKLTRDKNMGRGIYILRLADTGTGEIYTQKLIFK